MGIENILHIHREYLFNSKEIWSFYKMDKTRKYMVNIFYHINI